MIRVRLEATKYALTSRHYFDSHGPDSVEDRASGEALYGGEEVLRRSEQLDRLYAFQRLSPREQFDHWLKAQGRTRPKADEILGCPSLTTLVSVGLEWTPSVVRLPDEDRYGRLYYLVWTPRDPSWLTICRARNGWERVSDGSLMSGVTHWRIARSHERFSREVTLTERRTLERLNPEESPV